jgi:hypothetical protein
MEPATPNSTATEHANDDDTGADEEHQDFLLAPATQMHTKVIWFGPHELRCVSVGIKICGVKSEVDVACQ